MEDGGLDNVSAAPVSPCMCMCITCTCLLLMLMTAIGYRAMIGAEAEAAHAPHPVACSSGVCNVSRRDATPRPAPRHTTQHSLTPAASAACLFPLGLLLVRTVRTPRLPRQFHAVRDALRRGRARGTGLSPSPLVYECCRRSLIETPISSSSIRATLGHGWRWRWGWGWAPSPVAAIRP